jgi:hypothetical protein
MDYVEAGADRDHQRFILETELRDSETEAIHGVGWQTLGQWQALADLLIRYGALAADVDVEGAFTTEFLPEG